jgi:hypothetical protein
VLTPSGLKSFSSFSSAEAKEALLVARQSPDITDDVSESIVAAENRLSKSMAVASEPIAK